MNTKRIFINLRFISRLRRLWRIRRILGLTERQSSQLHQENPHILFLAMHIALFKLFNVQIFMYNRTFAFTIPFSKNKRILYAIDTSREGKKVKTTSTRLTEITMETLWNPSRRSVYFSSIYSPGGFQIIRFHAQLFFGHEKYLSHLARFHSALLIFCLNSQTSQTTSLWLHRLS